MKVKEIIKWIEDDGWKLHRQKGSHMMYKHHKKIGVVVIPNHGLNVMLKKGRKIAS